MAEEQKTEALNVLASKPGGIDLSTLSDSDKLALFKNLKKDIGAGTSARLTAENLGEDISGTVSGWGTGISNVATGVGEWSRDKAKTMGKARIAMREGLNKDLEEDLSLESLRFGKGSTRVGVFAIWTIITIVFLVLAGLIYQESKRDNPSVGLYVTMVLLQFFNLVMVFLNKTITSLIISIISFVIGLIFLIRSEDDIKDSPNCFKSENIYRLYIASHSFNIVLLTMSILRYFM